MTHPSELLVVREGSPARLVCEAVSGHPRAALSWSHPHISPRDLYTRASVTESRAVLSLAQVTRDMAGRYTCHGDNGYSPQPAQASVQLQVQCELQPLRKSEISKYVTRVSDPPGVTVTERLVPTMLGEEEELVSTNFIFFIIKTL